MTSKSPSPAITPPSPSPASSLVLDRAGALLALRMTIAALLAFSIAAALHVDNAYWAAMPVWVVAQASRGLLLERGFYRVLGTLIGAAAGFAFLALPLPHWGTLAFLGLWVGLGSAAIHMLSGVQTYGAMLAGMTAAVVVLPSLHNPQHVMTLALARVECTLIGVVVVTLVTGYFTPTARRRDYYQRVRLLAAAAADYAADAVAGKGTAAEAQARETQLLHDMSGVDAMAHAMAAGSLEGYQRLRHNTALIASSLSLMAAAISVRGRRARGKETDDGLVQQLQALASALRGAPVSGMAAASPWETSDAWGPEARLHEAALRLLAAEQALFRPQDAEHGPAEARTATRPHHHNAPSRASAAGAAEREQHRAYFKPPRDMRRAVWRGSVIGLATFLASWIGLISGWAGGELMALGVCIFSMILGSLPLPRQVIPKMIVGTLVGVIVAASYRFFVQPHVAGIVSLIISVAPVIAIGAVARAIPRTTMPALDANMVFMLASQAGAAAASASVILEGSLALLASAVIVWCGVWLWPDSTQGRLRATAQSIRQDVLRLLAERGPDGIDARTWHARTGRRLLRLLLDLQRAGLSQVTPPGLLATLSLGHAVAGLHGHASRLPPDHPDHAGIQAILAALRGFPEGPDQAASKALKAAEHITDDRVKQTVLDATAALREGSALLDAAHPYDVMGRAAALKAA